MKFIPRHVQKNVNITPISPLREFVTLLLGILGILLGVYVLLGALVNIVVPHVSIENEKRLATPFLKTLSGQTQFTETETHLQIQLDQILQNCVDLPYDFKIHVVQSHQANAAALPGGHIVVFSGLLHRIDSENELSFILSHELGHYAHRDHLRGLGRAMVFLSISTLILGPNSSVGNFIVHGLNLAELGFSRDQEEAADDYALQAVDCFYNHINGATAFFEKMNNEQDVGIFGHYFSTHPHNQKRIDHLKNMAAHNHFKMGPLKKLAFKVPSL
jgi:predicted Zn-dependent protease